MKRIIEKSIPNSGLRQDTVYTWVSNVLTPVLREARKIVNSRFGEITSVSSDYILGDNDEVVIVTTTSGAVDVYLPPLTGCSRTLVIKRVGANNVVIYPNAVDTAATIDGAASITIGTDYYSYMFVTNGGYWYTINRS